MSRFQGFTSSYLNLDFLVMTFLNTTSVPMYGPLMLMAFIQVDKNDKWQKRLNALATCVQSNIILCSEKKYILMQTVHIRTEMWPKR